MKDESTGHEPDEEFEVEEPRSIFSALWFRIVIGVAALGVIAGVAVPYVLEWTRPPLPERSSAARAARPAAPLTPQETPSSTASVPAAQPETARPVAAAPSVPVTGPTPSPVTPPAAPSDVKPAASASSATPPSPAGAGETKTALESTAAVRSESTPPAPRPSTEPDAARVASARAPARMTGDAGAGVYWVQVGAYKDAGTAERLAARLREHGYHVSEVAPAATPAETPSAPAPAPEPTATPRVDKYDVIVSGAPTATVTERLVARGLVADVTAAGVVVRPALSLAEAIALSKDLAVDGLKVQVRRAGLAPASRPAAGSAPAGTGAPASEALHRVRVGAYPDRATALAAAKELSAKGYEGFVARVAH